jgi:hypothetical protein
MNLMLKSTDYEALIIPSAPTRPARKRITCHLERGAFEAPLVTA